MILCYTHRLVPCSAAIKDENKYRDPQPHIMQRDLGTVSLKWDVSMKSLPSELRKSHRRGGWKNVRARGDGGHQENKSL